MKFLFAHHIHGLQISYFMTVLISVKYRETIYSRVQCSATVTTVLDTPSLEAHSNSVAANRSWSESTSNAVLDLEKLHLASLEVHSNSVATDRPWTHISDMDPPSEVSNLLDLKSQKHYIYRFERGKKEKGHRVPGSFASTLS